MNPDPTASALQPYAGDQRREGPIYTDAGPLGPFKGSVRVVPVVVRRLGWRFEIVADWTGPGLPGLPPAQHASVQDSVTVADRELAVKIAKGVAELLAAGEVPFMRHVKESFELAGDAWRGHYTRQLGDTGKSAAEGTGLTL